MRTVGPRVRIVVADDHPLFRRALEQTIRDQGDFQLVGQASDGGEAMELIRELAPNVAVLDVRMPVLDGLQVVSRSCCSHWRSGLRTYCSALSSACGNRGGTARTVTSSIGWERSLSCAGCWVWPVLRQAPCRRDSCRRQ
ncbi:response regulator transcription factor [Cryobacterium sp. M23]|uniref:response regulator n=1 Tax=Cryobacterium sp. M23 TaxID=2048292 RepID=UPI000CE37886